VCSEVRSKKATRKKASAKERKDKKKERAKDQAELKKRNVSRDYKKDVVYIVPFLYAPPSYEASVRSEKLLLTPQSVKLKLASKIFSFSIAPICSLLDIILTY